MNQGKFYNGGTVGNLTHVGVADFTLPTDLLRLRTMSDDEAARRVGVILMDTFALLNELAPHGYLPIQIAAMAEPGGKVGVKIRMQTTEADSRRIQSEWQPLLPRKEPPLQDV